MEINSPPSYLYFLFCIAIIVLGGAVWFGLENQISSRGTLDLSTEADNCPTDVQDAGAIAIQGDPEFANDFPGSSVTDRMSSNLAAWLSSESGTIQTAVPSDPHYPGESCSGIYYFATG